MPQFYLITLLKPLENNLPWFLTIVYKKLLKREKNQYSNAIVTSIIHWTELSQLLNKKNIHKCINLKSFCNVLTCGDSPKIVDWLELAVDVKTAVPGLAPDAFAWVVTNFTIVAPCGIVPLAC